MTAEKNTSAIDEYLFIGGPSDGKIISANPQLDAIDIYYRGSIYRYNKQKYYNSDSDTYEYSFVCGDVKFKKKFRN